MSYTHAGMCEEGHTVQLNTLDEVECSNKDIVHSLEPDTNTILTFTRLSATEQYHNLVSSCITTW